MKASTETSTTLLGVPSSARYDAVMDALGNQFPQITVVRMDVQTLARRMMGNDHDTNEGREERIHLGILDQHTLVEDLGYNIDPRTLRAGYKPNEDKDRRKLVELARLQLPPRDLCLLTREGILQNIPRRRNGQDVPKLATAHKMALEERHVGRNKYTIKGALAARFDIELDPQARTREDLSAVMDFVDDGELPVNWTVNAPPLLSDDGGILAEVQWVEGRYWVRDDKANGVCEKIRIALKEASLVLPDDLPIHDPLEDRNEMLNEMARGFESGFPLVDASQLSDDALARIDDYRDRNMYYFHFEAIDKIDRLDLNAWTRNNLRKDLRGRKALFDSHPEWASRWARFNKWAGIQLDQGIALYVPWRPPPPPVTGYLSGHG